MMLVKQTLAKATWTINRIHMMISLMYGKVHKHQWMMIQWCMVKEKVRTKGSRAIRVDSPRRLFWMICLFLCSTCCWVHWYGALWFMIAKRHSFYPACSEKLLSPCRLLSPSPIVRRMNFLDLSPAAMKICFHLLLPFFNSLRSVPIIATPYPCQELINLCPLPFQQTCTMIADLSICADWQLRWRAGLGKLRDRYCRVRRCMPALFQVSVERSLDNEASLVTAYWWMG